MRVYIAEKKEVASALSTALGGSPSPSGASYVAGDDRITWLWGHLLRLTDPEEHDERFRKWSMDQLPMAWPIGYAVGEKHADHLEAVIDLAKQADELVNAGDPDPEGQRLVDEVIEYAGLNGKPVKRILINDNTPSAIRNRRTKKPADTSPIPPLAPWAIERAKKAAPGYDIYGLRYRTRQRQDRHGNPAPHFEQQGRTARTGHHQPPCSAYTIQGGCINGHQYCHP